MQRLNKHRYYSNNLAHKTTQKAKEIDALISRKLTFLSSNPIIDRVFCISLLSETCKIVNTY